MGMAIDSGGRRKPPFFLCPQKKNHLPHIFPLSVISFCAITINTTGDQPRQPWRIKMTLEQIINQIRKMDVATIDATHDDITKKMKRARNPQIRLGYAIILENLELQKFIKTTEPCDLTDDELLAELAA